jgi:transposase InsO family protein
MGPYPVASLGGARYVVTLLDDYSSYASVHFVERKPAVGQVVRDTLVQWERSTGHKVKVLRTDNGTEYMGDLKRWLKATGIMHQLTAEYTPQQNVRAERLNRTLMDKARALLLQHNMPHEFWGYAVDTACYLKNCTAGEGETTTSYEIFHTKKPDLTTLRVFGCLAYVRVPEEQRGNQDARAILGVLS